MFHIKDAMAGILAGPKSLGETVGCYRFLRKHGRICAVVRHFYAKWIWRKRVSDVYLEHAHFPSESSDCPSGPY